MKASTLEVGKITVTGEGGNTKDGEEEGEGKGGGGGVIEVNTLNAINVVVEGVDVKDVGVKNGLKVEGGVKANGGIMVKGGLEVGGGGIKVDETGIEVEGVGIVKAVNEYESISKRGKSASPISKPVPVNLVDEEKNLSRSLLCSSN